MERLKIIINKDKSTAKEAKKLFKELEYYASTGLHDNKYGWVIDLTSGDYTNDINWFDKCQAKLVTIQQLHDLVVLKRNSIDDATHECKKDPEFKYRLIDNHWHVITSNNQQWRKDSITLEEAHLFMKPIEKEMKMKEYLNANYELITVSNEHPVCVDWIEVPEGAEKLLFSWINNNHKHFVSSDNKLMSVEDIMNGDSYWYGNAQEYICSISPDIIWQRQQQPGEPLFIDDEPILNEQYAEIEQVRQSAWQKQTGGDHYKKLAIQPMEYALKNKLDYAQANVVKYVTRHADKNGKEDLLKAIHNIELMIEHYYS